MAFGVASIVSPRAEKKITLLGIFSKPVMVCLYVRPLLVSMSDVMPSS